MPVKSHLLLFRVHIEDHSERILAHSYEKLIIIQRIVKRDIPVAIDIGETYGKLIVCGWSKRKLLPNNDIRLKNQRPERIRQTRFGFFDESGNTGTSGDYYVVAVILFHSTEEVFKSKAVLKRERKNNKRFNLKEFKFHDMHIGGDHLKTSLKRVLKNL